MANKTTHAYLENLLAHKRLVARYVHKATHALSERASDHDASKFSPAEFGPYARMLPRFDKALYGTDEYRACLRAIKPAVARHVKANRHHPEFFAHGINDMNLLDVLEMVCDWIAASQRTPGGTLRMDLQRERFAIDDQLYGILRRTAEWLMCEHEQQQQGGK